MTLRIFPKKCKEWKNGKKFGRENLGQNHFSIFMSATIVAFFLNGFLKNRSVVLLQIKMSLWIIEKILYFPDNR
jgi:hypothetical protein